MLAPIAVTLALAFWGAQHPEAPAPCPDGVTIVRFTSETLDGRAWLGDGCRIEIGQAANEYSAARLCALVAHELGHSLYELPDTDEGIMDVHTYTRPIPGVCYGPRGVSEVRRRARGKPVRR